MYCKKCGCKILMEEKCPECGTDVTEVEYCGGFWGLVGKTELEDETAKDPADGIIKEEKAKPPVCKNQEITFPVKKEKTSAIKEQGSEKKQRKKRAVRQRKRILIASILCLIAILTAVCAIQSVRLFRRTAAYEKYKSEYEILEEKYDKLEQKIDDMEDLYTVD